MNEEYIDKKQIQTLIQQSEDKNSRIIHQTIYYLRKEIMKNIDDCNNHSNTLFSQNRKLILNLIQELNNIKDSLGKKLEIIYILLTLNFIILLSVIIILSIYLL